MRWCARAALFAACAVSAIVESTDTTSSTIGFQLHSWDDLREWPAGLRKQAQVMKIDPHFVPASKYDSFCSKQVNVRNQTLAREHGCLVLVHDTPVSSNTIYNTTDDIFDVIVQLEKRRLLPLEGNKTFMIALCFKLDDIEPCSSNDPDATNWASLVDDFFDKATAFLAQHSHLNIEFILDGAATAGGFPARNCLQERWRPWVMTYIPFSDFLENSEAFFNDEGANSRFQVLNPVVISGHPTIEITNVAILGYGKFNNQSHYPWLNWEPSDANSIQAVAQVYLDFNERQQAGFRFAINVDPAQLAVYSAGQSGVAWGLPIPDTSGQSEPFLVRLSAPSFAHPQFPSSSSVFVLISAESSSKWSYRILRPSNTDTTNAFGPIDQLSAGLLPLSGPGSFLQDVISVSAPSTSSARGNALLMASQGGDLNPRFVVYGSDGNATLTVNGNGTFPSGGSTLATTLIDASRILRISTSPACAVTLEVFSEKPHSNWSVLVQDIKSFCMWTFANFPSPREVTVDVAAIPARAKSACCPQLGGTCAFVLASTENSLFQGFACISSQGVIMTARRVPLAPGNRPAVALTELTSSVSGELEIFATAAYNGGYCWNNEIYNKRPDVLLCSSSPASTPGVLSYISGPVSAWLDRIAISTTISACDEDLLHGSFGVGAVGSRVSLAVDAVVGSIGANGNKQNLRLSVVHEGLQNASSVAAAAACGLPKTTDSLVLDGWGMLF